jgi:uncharacterized protein (TIGR02217 family)
MSIATFPTLAGMSWPVARTPMMSTIKQAAISGKETRLQLWTYPRYKYEIALEYLGSFAAVRDWQNQDWQTFLGFWNALGGAALPFHWTDFYDKAVTSQSLGVGDGATTKFNFIRNLGGFVEPVQDVGAVTQVTVAGTPTTGYTLLTDPNWGLVYGIQFNTAPASGAALAASFTYNWVCRFDEDTADLSNIMFNFWQLKKITFTTMKVV